MKLNFQFVIAVVFLIVYFIFIVWLRLRLPAPEELIKIITNLYSSFGYPIVFASGLLEGMFLVGFYVPGSAAILLGAVVAKSGVIFLPVVLTLATLGLVIAYTVNYFLGRYGWFQVLAQFGLKQGIDTAKDKLKKHEKKALFFGFLSPNSGAFVSTAAGILKMPFGKFLLWAIVSQSLWSIVWGLVAYTLGNVFVELFLKYFMYIAYGVIIIFLIKQGFFKK